MNTETKGILIVDDEEPVRRSLRRNLMPLGMPVATLSSGVEALAWLQENEPVAIVADYCMPGMDGIAFLRKAKEILPETRRMMLTGVDDLNIALQAINEDLIERYMTKPWDPEKLRNAVERLAGRG